MGNYYILRYLVDDDWFIQWMTRDDYDPDLSVDDIDVSSKQSGPVYNGNLLKGNRNQSCCLNQYI